MGRITLAQLRPALLAGALLLGNGIARAETGSVEAACGSIAIGGTPLGSTIKINGTVVCGIPPEKLQRLIQALIQDKTREIQDKTRDLQNLSVSQEKTIGFLEKDLDLN